jgi:hypothetical protein
VKKNGSKKKYSYNLFPTAALSASGSVLAGRTKGLISDFEILIFQRHPYKFLLLQSYEFLRIIKLIFRSRVFRSPSSDKDTVFSGLYNAVNTTV